MASNTEEAMDSSVVSDIHCVDFSEEDIFTSCSNETDAKFDLVIGHIEDIIMEEEFQTLQNNFLEKFYKEFEDTEENKFIYTDIHKEYINLVEKFLESELSSRIQDFSMQEFTAQLMERRSELDGEIFEMLLTFSDFVLFKEMFIDYRASKEGTSLDLSNGLTVTSVDVPTECGLFELTGQSMTKKD